MEELGHESPETHYCMIKLRLNPLRRRKKVVIGCGAGFGGDRPMAALKLLQRVKELDYLVLECLVERYSAMKSCGKEWMQLLLPVALERGVRIIANIGAKSPYGAQEEVLQIARKLGINVSVGVPCQSSVSERGTVDIRDVSVYQGAAPIVECLERYTHQML